MSISRRQSDSLRRIPFLGTAHYRAVQDNRMSHLDPQGREHMNLDPEHAVRGLVVHTVDVPMHYPLLFKVQ